MGLLSVRAVSFGQGRIVVNEFMSWSGCNTTSEFIELLNFGPGPMNIGCFIVTNGQYAITIPANTVLQPGQYFLLAGQDVIQKDCGNTDSTVSVHLNWTTCNCTDKPVPTTGDGFFQNGGNSNEKVVLLDPLLNVYDAVSRSSTISNSISITTAANGGSCVIKTFNLGEMSINYESINISTGINNSFSRRVDGDCGWVKTTAISANAPNKTGSTSSSTYSFSTLSASECAGTAGKVSIAVNAPDLAALFPMTYTLAFDNDGNNIFTETDLYSYGTDSSQPSIDLTGLAYGRYRITVGSSSGCNLQSFDFFIFNCYGIVLASDLLALSYKGFKEDYHSFRVSMNGIRNVQSIELEGGEGSNFKEVSTLPEAYVGVQNNFEMKAPVSAYLLFRVKVTDENNQVYYSTVVRVPNRQIAQLEFWPNPADQRLFIRLAQEFESRGKYSIVNSMGITVSKGEIFGRAGDVQSIPVAHLPGGTYQLVAMGTNQIISQFRFVKK